MSTAKIRITRDNDTYAMSRKLKVFIDENHIGDVLWNDTSEFITSSGEHLVHVKMDWCRSAPLKIKLKQDEIIELDVVVPGGTSGLESFGRIYATFVNSSRFFSLKAKKH